MSNSVNINNYGSIVQAYVNFLKHICVKHIPVPGQIIHFDLDHLRHFSQGATLCFA